MEKSFLVIIDEPPTMGQSKDLSMTKGEVMDNFLVKLRDPKEGQTSGKSTVNPKAALVKKSIVDTWQTLLYNSALNRSVARKGCQTGVIQCQSMLHHQKTVEIKDYSVHNAAGNGNANGQVMYLEGS